MATKQQCSKTIWRGRMHSYAQCSRTASVERDGEHYCKQHDPVAVAEKKQARDAAWDAEWAEKSRVARLNAAAPDLLAAAKRSLQGWDNAIELAIILPQHRNTATILADELRAAIAKATGKQEG